MSKYHITSGRKREEIPGKIEYRWTCTCGKKSVWFPTYERREAAKERHIASHVTTATLAI